MNEKIKKYYNALKVLRTAQNDVQIIYHLENILQNYERYYAVTNLSNVLTTYKFEIDKIGQLTGMGDVEIDKNLEPIEKYNQDEISDKKIKNDILYAIDCLIIIFAVKNYMATSIEEAVKYVLS